MSHLNPSPNLTKTQTQSERQNRSERNREERESESERRDRDRYSQQHPTHRRRRSLAHNPQPICYHGPGPLHHRAITIEPPYNPAKTHAIKPITHNPTAHDPHATTAMTKPPAQCRHHRERLAERALI